MQQITQNIDMMPTILDFMGIEIPDSVQGVSLKPLAQDPQAKTKDYAIFGYHGMAVNLSDGHHTYLRAPKPENQPCYEYTAFPTTIRRVLGVECPEKIEMGRYFKRTQYPLFRIPITKPGIIDQSDEPLKEVLETKLFDICADYGQTKNLAGVDSELEARYIELLSQALDAYDAPQEQKERLGIQ